MQGKQMGSRVKGGASWPRGAAWGAGRGKIIHWGTKIMGLGRKNYLKAKRIMFLECSEDGNDLE